MLDERRDGQRYRHLELAVDSSYRRMPRYAAFPIVGTTGNVDGGKPRQVGVIR